MTTVVLHKVMLAGEGCFVTHGISMLFIRGNWGRALSVYHYPHKKYLPLVYFFFTICPPH